MMETKNFIQAGSQKIYKREFHTRITCTINQVIGSRMKEIHSFVIKQGCYRGAISLSPEVNALRWGREYIKNSANQIYDY